MPQSICEPPGMLDKGYDVEKLHTVGASFINEEEIIHVLVDLLGGYGV